jgi:hypothetical protein
MAKLDYSYDPTTDTATIEGIRFSGDVFRNLAFWIEPGQWYQLVSRSDDGLLVIRKQHEGEGPS